MSSCSASLSSATTVQTAYMSSTSKTWVVDFGAYDHITGSSKILALFYSNGPFSTMTMVEGLSSTVKKVAMVNSTSLSLVLYVPNFLSINKLTHPLNCSISIFPGWCFF